MISGSESGELGNLSPASAIQDVGFLSECTPPAAFWGLVSRSLHKAGKRPARARSKRPKGDSMLPNRFYPGTGIFVENPIHVMIHIMVHAGYKHHIRTWANTTYNGHLFDIFQLFLLPFSTFFRLFPRFFGLFSDIFSYLFRFFFDLFSIVPFSSTVIKEIFF